MKCKVCGTDQQEENRFCTYCGAPLHHDEDAEVHEAKPAPVIREDASSQDEKKTEGTWSEVHDEPREQRAGEGFVGWMRKMSEKAEALIAWSKDYGGMYLALGIVFVFSLLDSWKASVTGVVLGFTALGLIYSLIFTAVAFLIERAIVKYALRKALGNDEIEGLDLHIAWSLATFTVLGFVANLIFRGLFLSMIVTLFLGALIATIFMMYALLDGEEMKFFWKYLIIRLIIQVIFIVLLFLMLASCARGMVNAFPPELFQEFHY